MNNYGWVKGGIDRADKSSRADLFICDWEQDQALSHKLENGAYKDEARLRKKQRSLSCWDSQMPN